MKALFLTADLGGNVPPTLAIADELAGREVDVEIAGLQDGRTRYPEPPFPAAVAAGPDGGKGLAKSGAMMRLMAARSTRAQTAALVAERAPDVVIADCMTAAPLRGALESGVPVVVLFHTISQFWAQSFDRRAGFGLGLLGLRPKKLWASAELRLMLTDSELDPGSTDPTLHDFVWTGTTEKGVEPVPRRPEARPRVLVSLSSTDWPGMLPVYRRVVSILSKLPVDALVTTGGVDLAGTLNGAPNVEVRGWVDHAEILPRTDLVIGHGGHSTTMKVLAHGIPLLVLPINPVSDQSLMGSAVEAAGVGRRLPKSVREPRLAQAVATMLADERLRERSAATGRRLRAATPGAKAAADRILDRLMRGQGSHG